MNLFIDGPLPEPSSKRGEIARKLLKAAKRAKRSRLPPPQCDEVKESAGDGARVLGPYRNGPKWRLIVREGTGRKSLVFDTRDKQFGDDDTYTLRYRPTPSANVRWTAEKIDVQTLVRLKIAAKDESPSMTTFCC